VPMNGCRKSNNLSYAWRFPFIVRGEEYRGSIVAARYLRLYLESPCPSRAAWSSEIETPSVPLVNPHLDLIFICCRRGMRFNLPPLHDGVARSRLSLDSTPSSVVGSGPKVQAFLAFLLAAL